MKLLLFSENETNTRHEYTMRKMIRIFKKNVTLLIMHPYKLLRGLIVTVEMIIGMHR